MCSIQLLKLLEYINSDFTFHINFIDSIHPSLYYSKLVDTCYAHRYERGIQMETFIVKHIRSKK